VHPQGLVACRRARSAGLDAYVACLQEAAFDLGLLEQAVRRIGATRRSRRAEPAA
jgi:hypothetical protein